MSQYMLFSSKFRKKLSIISKRNQNIPWALRFIINAKLLSAGKKNKEEVLLF